MSIVNALLVDRLSELRSRSGRVITGPSSSSAPLNEAMGDFFGTVGEIQSELLVIKQSIDKLESFRGQLIQATTSKQEAAVRLSLDEAISETNKLVLRTKGRIEAVQSATESFEQQNPGSSDVRMRKNIVLTIVRRFKEHLVAFQAAQSSFAEDARGRAVRQLQVAMPSTSTEEANKLVSEGATAADAITKKLQVTAVVQQDQNAAHMTVIKHLYGLQDRMSDLRRLEESIAGLHQMFVEMAALVDKQGEMLDHIEVSVTNTKNYTKDAEKALVNARQKQHNNEKKTLMLCCCCLILLIIVLVPMWISGKIGR